MMMTDLRKKHTLVSMEIGETLPYRFHPIDEDWQRTACQTMGLEFVRRCDLGEGGPNVPLTSPHRVKSILGDGNCLFRSFSYLITGTEQQHGHVREAISTTCAVLNIGC